MLLKSSRKFVWAATVALLLVVSTPVAAQFTGQLQVFWQELSTGAIAFITGRVQANGYFNYGNTVGTNGYGFRDNSGTMQVKNSGGAWANITGAGGAVSGYPITCSSDGTALLPCFTWASAPTTGFYLTGGAIGFSVVGTAEGFFHSSQDAFNHTLASATALGLESSLGATPDVLLVRDAANILALKNGTTSQTFHVYGPSDSAVPATNTMAHIFAGATVINGQVGAGGDTNFGNNFYYNSGWKYIVTGKAGKIGFNTAADSVWSIQTAISGTAGAAISWVEQMRISPTAITANLPIVVNGSGMAVANVGANSCGTTAATIAGNNNLFTITVGATAGTQCRVAFTLAAPNEWGCAASDDTTTVAVRTTPVDTTHVDFLGTFTAGDKVTGVCFAR